MHLWEKILHCVIISAVEIVGHDTPVLVGLSRDINCTSHLNVTKMEWILVGVGETVEKREDGGRSLALPVKPTNTGLDGTRFTCRVTTVTGKVFEKTITVHVKGKPKGVRKMARLKKQGGKWPVLPNFHSYFFFALLESHLSFPHLISLLSCVRTGQIRG